MLFAALATAAVGAASACSAPEDPAPPKVGVTRSRLTVHPTTKRIRVAHWNTFARPSTGSVMSGSEGSADPVEVHGPLVAETVKRHMGEFDVIVFNEVFTDIAREAVYDALKAEFPHWVKEIDGPLTLLPTANLSDSGLAIFSRFPFGDLTEVPGGSYFEYSSSDRREFLDWCAPGDPKAGVSTPEERAAGDFRDNRCPWSRTLGFQYTENKDDDAKAAKGWGLVRILGPGTPLNVGFSHLQADYPEKDPPAFYPDVRAKQLKAIKKLLADRVGPEQAGDTILVGDLNIDGLASNFREPGSPATAANPNPKMMDSEYGKSIFGQVDGLPFYDVWRTTSPQDDGQTHRFFGPPARYDYFLLNGAGYYDSVSPWDPLAPKFVTNYGHGFTCPQYIRRAFQDGPSDHIGLLLDLGPWSEACRPDMAIRPEAGPGWAASGQHLKAYSLPEPGAVMWYRFDGPGTYTVGFPAGSDAAQRLRIEAYPVNDLSFVIPPIDKSSSTRVPGVEGDFETSTFFSGTQPFYLRVFDPEGLSSGSFDLLLRKYDCSSVTWECALKPAVEKVVDPPVGQSFNGHFRINTLSTGTGQKQQGVFEVRNPSGQELRVTIGDVRSGQSRTFVFNDTDWKAKIEEVEENVYRVMVERSNNTQGYAVTYKTDLTFFTGFPDQGASLTLLEETAGWGNDEIRAVLKKENGNAAQEWFWAEMDKDEGMPLFVTLPFRTPISLYVAELGAEEYSPLDMNAVDESARVYISPLDPSREKELGVVRDFQLCELPPNQADCQGKLQLRYNLVHSLDP